MIAPDSIAAMPDATQLACKLHQAVLSLAPTESASTRQVHRMARSLALAELHLACRRSTPALSPPR